MIALPLPTLLSQRIQKSQTTKPLSERIETLNATLAPEVRIEATDHDSLIIWLTRTDKRNALSFVMMDKLIALATTLATWTDVRAVILAGEGKSFSTGIDLADLNNAKNLKKVAWELIKPCQSKFQKVCLAWRELPIPVVSVLHGHCLGAGLQLALASDIRFATADCQFAIMESKWGLVADMGLTQSAFGQLKTDVVKELAMTARMFDGKQALDYGVISYVSDTPMDDAKALVAELVSRSPDAVLASKRIVNAMYRTSAITLYQEKFWQIKLLIGNNRKLAVKKAKDETVKFMKRQFG
ncbi:MULTISPECIES: crotonase/enoyl-CoA hydratase family protein [unclassified Moraxella]|uniref:crotonase/enoyl-CoA hydratase family protein n=1 Tax=unclassified Moraxella TaxID=2685852 RepID=UPI003AF927BD